MKKYNKYIEWIPFGISAGALFLYLRYVMMFKLDSNLVMTETIHETLNTYLIVLFISLFIGLFIILIKKIFLLKNETTKEIKLVSDKKEKISNVNKYDYNLLKVKVSDKMYTTLLKGKILGSNDDIEILFDDDYSYNNVTNIKDPRKCPKCDNIINKDAFICTKCGIILNKKALSDVISDFNIKQEKYYEKPKKKLSILIANIIIIILSIFLIFLIGNKLMNERNKNLDNLNLIEEIDN